MTAPYRIVTFASSLYLAILLSSLVRGDLIFRQIGSDLEITNQAVISWTPGEAKTRSASWGLAFETAYTTPNPTSLFFSPVSNLILTVGGIPSSGALNFGVRGISVPSSSNMSFNMSFSGGPLTISSTDTVRLSAGSATFANWFNLGGRLPDDLGELSVFLRDTAVGTSVIGTPGHVVLGVPEPSSLLLTAISVAFLTMRQRRTFPTRKKTTNKTFHSSRGRWRSLYQRLLAATE